MGILDEIECAQAYLWLKEYYQYTTEDLATLCSVSRPVISNQLRLLNLPSPHSRMATQQYSK